MTKVAVASESGEIETMWAEVIGSGRYRLRNLPYLAVGLALDDIVTVKPAETGEWPMLDEVVERSGHSTYRIALQDGQSFEGAFAKAWNPLRHLGCALERFSDRFAGVDVPTETDVDQAYQLLEQGMADGVWWFDEVQVGHPPAR
jgi:hypothetical protein